jgi:predicted CxxxxCH...CXXCH cytochrome family protein
MKKSYVLIAGFAIAALMSCSERASDPSAVSAKTCGLCHDLPPKDRAHLYHVDTLHYRCSYCHGIGYEADSATGAFTVNQLTHMNGDTDVVFTAPWDDSGKAAYDKSVAQCSNVYCHGGIPQGTHATAQWYQGEPIGGRCYACHDSAGMATYHYGHARRAVTSGANPCGGNVNQCGNCHDSAYSVPNGTVDSAAHINGVFDPGTCGACHAQDGWSTWEEYKATHPSAKRLAGSGAPMSMRLK